MNVEAEEKLWFQKESWGGKKGINIYLDVFLICCWVVMLPVWLIKFLLDISHLLCLWRDGLDRLSLYDDSMINSMATATYWHSSTDTHTHTRERLILSESLAQLPHRYNTETLTKSHECASSDCQSSSRVSVFPAQRQRVWQQLLMAG